MDSSNRSQIGKSSLFKCLSFQVPSGTWKSRDNLPLLTLKMGLESQWSILLVKHHRAKQHNIIVLPLAKDSYNINFKSYTDLSLTKYFCKMNPVVKVFNENTSIKIKRSAEQQLLNITNERNILKHTWPKVRPFAVLPNSTVKGKRS